MVISFQKIISHGLSSPLFSLLNQFILLATPFQVFYPTYVLHIIPICPVKTNRFYIFAPHANQSKMIMIPYISYFDYQPRQSVKFLRTFFYLYLRSIPGFICSSTKLAHSQFTWIARYISCTIQQLPLLFFIFFSNHPRGF